MIPSRSSPLQVRHYVPSIRVCSPKYLIRLAWCLAAITATTQSVLAAQDAADRPAPSLAPRIEQVRAELDGLDATVRDANEKLLSTALAADREADRLLAEARSLRDTQPARLAELARLERTLSEDPSEAFRRWRAQLPARVAHEELARRLAEARRMAEQSEIERSAVTAELAAVVARPAAVTEELARQRQEVDRLRALVLPGGADTIDRVAALGSSAAQRLAAARVLQLEAEQTQLPEQRRLLELRQRVLQRETELNAREIDVLEALLAERSEAEISTLMQRLRTEQAAVASGETTVQREADANLAFGEELERTALALREASERVRRAQRDRANVAESLRNTRARLALGAEDDGIGLILLSERLRLAEPDKLASELDATRRRYAKLQLRLIELDEQRDRLDAPDRVVADTLGAIDSDEAPETDRLRGELTSLFATRADLLPRLEAAQRDLSDALVQLERALQEQLAGTRELRQILDRRLLWVPSHEPVGLGWLQRQTAGWGDLFKLSRYQTSARLLHDSVVARGPLVALGMLVFLALLWLRLRVPARLDELSQPLMRVRTDRYRYSARSLLLTLLAALPWPLFLAMLGWLLRHAGTSGKFTASLGLSLISLASGVLLWQVLHWVTRERGLAHLHFRWTRARRAALRSTLPWLAFGLLPLQWLITLAFVRAQEPAIDAAARLMLLAFCVIGAHLSWRVLAPGAVWTPRGVARIEPARLRQALRLLLPGLLMLLVGLALQGYVLTVGVMLSCLWMSAGTLLAVALLHGMIARWFLLGERRLALKRLEQKRSNESGPDDASGNATGDAMPDLEPEEVTLESINAQTRRLLRALTIALVAVSLLWVWSDVLPALARLDEIVMWGSSSLGADGKPLSSAVTLRDVLLGLAVLLLTVIAARNLPGLVELGLLSRIHIDAPTRYAITSLSRYVIAIGGVIAGLGLLGMRWSQLQWMAAALTVGLGFGLQEIFANFVSGLIILFERPYRVGDIITIGEVEGTVTRIRTRATTVMDWDNKEVVVPNKTFITERFVNWTLSDTVTRVVLKIGVAYSSDADSVRQMLLDLARADARVLRDPPPTCWLLSLGASTLDFELRVFVGEILDRNRVRNALLENIIEVFRERGVEIAFPQMDLWVRNAPPHLDALEAGTRPDPASKR